MASEKPRPHPYKTSAPSKPKPQHPATFKCAKCSTPYDASARRCSCGRFS